MPGTKHGVVNVGRVGVRWPSCVQEPGEKARHGFCCRGGPSRETRRGDGSSVPYGVFLHLLKGGWMRWRHLEQSQAGSSCFNDLPSAHPLGHAVSDLL